jgi:hypothetical protein
MYAITVSVHYSDLLDIILPQNHHRFQKWYIVTEENDTATLDILQKYNFENVETLFFDFRQNAVFNKGGGVRLAQTKIPEGEMVLLLDSDIFIPTDLVLDHSCFENDTLYSVERRDYHTYSNWKNGKHDQVYPKPFMGFFQLYQHDSRKYMYLNSQSCRECDHEFYTRFSKRVLLDGFLQHLGKDNVHHFGRKSLDDDFIQEKTPLEF